MYVSVVFLWLKKGENFEFIREVIAEETNSWVQSDYASYPETKVRREMEQHMILRVCARCSVSGLSVVSYSSVIERDEKGRSIYERTYLLKKIA